MQLTKQWLKQHNACEQGIQAFTNQKETDSIKILKLLIRSNTRENIQWANWLISRLFKNRKQRVQYCVYAARLVLSIFEEKYPEDLGSRKAIEAAERYIENPSKKNQEACRKASASASASASAYYAACAAYTAADAATAAASYSASDASSAAAYAAEVAYTVYNQTLTKILKYGITLLQ